MKRTVDVVNAMRAENDRGDELIFSSLVSMPCISILPYECTYIGSLEDLTNVCVRPVMSMTVVSISIPYLDNLYLSVIWWHNVMIPSNMPTIA